VNVLHGPINSDRAKDKITPRGLFDSDEKHAEKMTRREENPDIFKTKN
jgi:hypothetical protein